MINHTQNEVITTISKVVIDDGDLSSLYEEVNPGVVAIRALTEEGGGLGTGFVWDEEGHIVTNFHVVQSATDLEVDFPSGFKTRAQVLGSDPDSDLAVLELDQLPPELKVLTLGRNHDLLVGQTVIAIGNPQVSKLGTLCLGQGQCFLNEFSHVRLTSFLILKDCCPVYRRSPFRH